MHAPLPQVCMHRKGLCLRFRSLACDFALSGPASFALLAVWVRAGRRPVLPCAPVSSGYRLSSPCFGGERRSAHLWLELAQTGRAVSPSFNHLSATTRRISFLSGTRRLGSDNRAGCPSYGWLAQSGSPSFQRTTRHFHGSPGGGRRSLKGGSEIRFRLTRPGKTPLRRTSFSSKRLSFRPLVDSGRWRNSGPSTRAYQDPCR